MNENLSEPLLLHTIHDLAKQARYTLITELGEKNFVRALLDFDRRIKNEVGRVLYLIQVTPNKTLFELALCWLDGKGFSDYTVFDLCLSKNWP